MTVERVRRKNEEPIHGTGIPMASGDGEDIKINDILYSPSYSRGGSSYGRQKASKFNITPHRVIQIDYEYRYIRLRCPKGCESTVKFAEEGCSTDKYYHKLSSAIDEVLDDIGDNVKDVADLEQYYKNVRLKLAELSGEVKKFKPKALPKAIKV